LNNLKMENQKGFTIIELMISIFVLTIAIIGAYNAFTIMDLLTSNSMDRFTAAYLAQEGVEIIRNIRDTNWLEGVSWTDGLDDCASGCEVDYKTFGDEFTPLSPYVETLLLVDETGFYNYESGEETKFKRKVTITPLQTAGEENDILKVEVEVFWSGTKSMIYYLNSEAEESIKAEEYLYNWH